MSYTISDSTTIEQLMDGYTEDDGSYGCMFCGESFRKGHIYRLGQELVDAELAARSHMTSAHGSVFRSLIALGKKSTGLTEIQRTMLNHFYEGLPDRAIQPLAGGVSLSTIRNHRFTLREKARQAKVFLALMELLEKSHQDPDSSFIEIPGRRSAGDERFAITNAEFSKIVRANFPDGPDGMLARFPRKQKHKIAVLVQILKRFDVNRRYTQSEVNEILATASEDYTTLCRYMVDYGFLGRTRDGSEYWLE